jgi:hypothetical protein
MYLKFEEYLKIAEKIVGKASYCGIQISEDNIAYVAEYLMLADTRYKEDSGLTRDEFRALYAKYARLKLFRQKKKKKFENSLDWCYLIGKEGKEVSLKYVLEDKKAEKPDNRIKNQEIINTINNSPLDEKERGIVIDYLFSKDSLTEIGNRNSISPKYIHRVINSLIKKMSAKLKKHI